MSAIKPLAIFQPLPSEVQEIIVSQCDVDTLVTLSGVNKSESENLANEVFFKAYYIEHHPRLKPYDRLFTVLCSTHPSNCWKVICQIMHVPRNLPIASRISPSFTQKTAEKIRLQILECEQFNKSICGSGYQDPNSSIHQAWKEFIKYQGEYNTANCEYKLQTQQLLEAINHKFAGKQVEVDFTMKDRIFNQFDYSTNKLLSSSYEEFIKKSPKENAAISSDQFSYFQGTTEFGYLTHALLNKVENLKNLKGQSHTKYVNLENQRSANETKQQKLSNCLANPGAAYIEELSATRNKALDLETALADIASLEACQALIDDLIKNPAKRTPEAHQKILGFINSLKPDLRRDIWSDLYHSCANQVIEDCWAEKHCMDHLQPLRALVAEPLRNLKYYMDTEGPKYMSFDFRFDQF